MGFSCTFFPIKIKKQKLSSNAVYLVKPEQFRRCKKVCFWQKPMLLYSDYCWQMWKFSKEIGNLPRSVITGNWSHILRRTAAIYTPKYVSTTRRRYTYIQQYPYPEGQNDQLSWFSHTFSTHTKPSVFEIFQPNLGHMNPYI